MKEAQARRIYQGVSAMMRLPRKDFLRHLMHLCADAKGLALRTDDEEFLRDLRAVLRRHIDH
jgi:hypothetical protein